MFYSDPAMDFEQHDRQQAKQLANLPICMDCGEPIQTDICFEINGEYICPDCLETYHQKDVADCV